MAESMLRAGGRFWTWVRCSNQSRISSSINRQRRRFPSPSGCAGTWPSRAQQMSVRLSIRRMAAASLASRIFMRRLFDEAVSVDSFGILELISEFRTRTPVFLVFQTTNAASVANQFGSSPIKCHSGIIPGGYRGRVGPSLICLVAVLEN